PSSALRVYAIQLGFAHSSDPYRNHDCVVAHVATAALVDGLGVVAEAGVRLMADRTFQDGAFGVSTHGGLLSAAPRAYPVGDLTWPVCSGSATGRKGSFSARLPKRSPVREATLGGASPQRKRVKS